MDCKVLTKNREYWTVTDLALAGGGRVTGSLWHHGHMQRKKFVVRLNADRTFEVDIGTGSGIKIKFQVLE